MILEKSGSRNLFEVDNARYLTRDEVVHTFVPTPSFWRLLSAKNHVVLGARGSGKTAILRMLAHDHLSKWNDEQANELIEAKSFIGIYVPTKVGWVGSLKSKAWESSEQKEQLFRWRLNVSACTALLTAISSCLQRYFRNERERIEREVNITDNISKAWFGNEVRNIQLRDLNNHIEQIEFTRQRLYTETRSRGESSELRRVASVFDMHLFAPLERAIKICSDILDFPAGSVWMLCVDEMETLDEEHQRILNSHLRTHSGNLVFKFSMTPYGHRTLETNTAASLNVGHDFEYVYIDQDPASISSGKSLLFKFEMDLLQKRAALSQSPYQFADPQKLLGLSPLLDFRPRVRGTALEDFLSKLAAVGDEKLVERANRLSTDSRKLGNEVFRKVQGALALRLAVARARGRAELDVYAGASMIIRCSDANPRRLIRIFNKLLQEGNWRLHVDNGEQALVAITPGVQSRILRSFSVTTLTRVQVEPVHGPEMYHFIRSIGDYMHHTLHNLPLTSDQVTSIQVDEATPDHIWEIIKESVSIGLLYPNINYTNPDEMPERQGVFHLAYVLAPCFEILPRRGKARALSSILAFSTNTSQPVQLPLGV